MIKGTAAGATVAAEESKPKEETKTKEEVKPKEEKTPASALKSKRGSVFGSVPFFGKKKDETPKKEEEAPPAVPAKDTTTKPVSDTAPQLESPVKPEDATPPAAPAIENKDTTKETSEAAVPAATAVPAASAKTKDSEKPERKSSESKGGLFGFLKQKEAQHEVSFQSNRIINEGNLMKV